MSAAALYLWMCPSCNTLVPERQWAAGAGACWRCVAGVDETETITEGDDE